jgi:hypothetical protein
MVMSRAEYESLASAINEADVPKGYRVILALEIATALCATNDRFDPVRFMEQTDLNTSAEEISGYSHALYLRTKTGVGAARNQIRANG